MLGNAHPIDVLLKQLLKEDSFLIGEVLVSGAGKEILLRHYKSDDLSITRRSKNVADARFFARFDSSGAYRPLKSAPNLPADWELTLPGLYEARLAIDDFYPAALGMLLARMEGRLAPVDFMKTATRQTGMYRIVGRIEPELAQESIGATCHPQACMRVILWRLSEQTPLKRLPREKFETTGPASILNLPRIYIPTLGRQVPQVPIYCAEACNLLVAACRSAIKKEQKSTFEVTASALNNRTD